MVEPTPEEAALQQIAAAGVASHERFARNLRALDYAWLDGNRGLLAKPIAEVTIADVAARLRGPFDAVLDRIIAEETSLV